MIARVWMISLSICYLCSCGLFSERRSLTFIMEPYDGKSLRINGYFVEQEDTVPSQVKSICLFYKNGVILDAGSFSQRSFEQIEKNLMKPFTDREKNLASMWGLYWIRGDSLSFEKYHSGNGGPDVFARLGVILNDSTFRITKVKNSYSGEVNDIDEVYRFRKFSPKPDSTNNIVK